MQAIALLVRDAKGGDGGDGGDRGDREGGEL